MPTKQKKPTKKIKPKSKKTYIYIAIGILMVIILLYFLIETTDKEGQEKTKKRGLEKTQTKDVSIKKQAPFVPLDKARLELISLGGKDNIRVLVDREDPEMIYRYQWTINGNILKDYVSDTVSNFKEGDIVGVLITPIKGEKEGQPRYLSLTIDTVTPKVSGMSEPKIEKDIMEFKILTDSKDGGAFSFTSIKVPDGMVIDGKKGVVKWPIKDVPAGIYEGSVSIKNQKGAETIYTFAINLKQNK